MTGSTVEARPVDDNGEVKDEAADKKTSGKGGGRGTLKFVFKKNGARNERTEAKETSERIPSRAAPSGTTWNSAGVSISASYANEPGRLISDTIARHDHVPPKPIQRENSVHSRTSRVIRRTTDFTEFYWVLPGFPRFYWALLGFAEHDWVFSGFQWVFTGLWFSFFCLSSHGRFGSTRSSFCFVTVSDCIGAHRCHRARGE